MTDGSCCLSPEDGMYIARWYFEPEPPPALPELMRYEWSTPLPPSDAAGPGAAAKGDRPTAPHSELAANGVLAKGDAPMGEAEPKDGDSAIGELPAAPGLIAL